MKKGEDIFLLNSAQKDLSCSKAFFKKEIKLPLCKKATCAFPPVLQLADTRSSCFTGERR